jgi:hypothetical protein
MLREKFGGNGFAIDDGRREDDFSAFLAHLSIACITDLPPAATSSRMTSGCPSKFARQTPQSIAWCHAA